MSGRVAIALSGGVDSAVAGLLLRRAGLEVEGLHMTNWDEDEDGYCSAAEDYRDAKLVAAELGIPLHRVSFAEEYRARVFQHFLDEYRAGRTPNPDVLCNREVKFGVCLDYARRLGLPRVATGHYAQLTREGTGTLLRRGLDPTKDQSYFLHQVPDHALAAGMFPVGELPKAEVRRIAREAGLPVHAKRDSTGICFIGERPFREFLARYLKGEPGPMETPEGKLVGQHQGLMFHTLGQRQGLGIGGAGEAWYVAAKDIRRNALIVVQGHGHPALLRHSVVLEDCAWIAGVLPAGSGLSARLRYRQADLPCALTALDGNRVQLDFASAQWAVTPGQFGVLYRGEVCLGGGVIT